MRVSRVFSSAATGIAIVVVLAACGSSGGGKASVKTEKPAADHGGMSAQEMKCMDKDYAEHNHGKCDGAAKESEPYKLANPLKVGADGLVDAASVDLSGVQGVSAQKEKEATDLLVRTIKILPKWSDIEKAKADGFQSIGDGGTGEEHLLHWDWVNDDTIFDPNYPESLVYKVDRATGTKTLEAAMYILPDRYTLENPHPIDSPLVQFHYHDNLCFTKATPELGPQVRGLTDAQGNCTSPFAPEKFSPNIQVHVWIRPNECGPFAALLGVGAGQIVEGAERSCVMDHTKLTL